MAASVPLSAGNTGKRRRSPVPSPQDSHSDTNGSTITPLLQASSISSPVATSQPLTFTGLPNSTIATPTVTSTEEIQSVYGPLRRQRAGPGGHETSDDIDEEEDERWCPKCTGCTREGCTEFIHVTWIRFKYYLSHALIEARKRKVQYCLGFSSIFFVVVIAAIYFTLVAKAPAVFLQQAETTVGQIDVLLEPVAESSAPYLNYTLLQTQPRTASLYATPRWSTEEAILYPVDCTTYLQSFGLVTPLTHATAIPWKPSKAPRPRASQFGWSYTGPYVPTETIGTYATVPGLDETLIQPSDFPSGCTVSGSNCLADMCRPITDSSSSSPPPVSPTGAEVRRSPRINPLVAWDSSRDRAIGLGRAASDSGADKNPALRPLPAGHISLPREVATRLGATQGDTIVASFPTRDLMKFVLRDSMIWASELKDGEPGTQGPDPLPVLTPTQRANLINKPVLSLLEHAVETLVPYIHVPLYVAQVSSSTKGRLGSDDEGEVARVEYRTVLDAFISNLHPSLFVKNSLVLAALTDYKPSAYDTTLPSETEAVLPWTLGDLLAKAASTPRVPDALPNADDPSSPWTAKGDTYWADLRDYATSIAVNAPPPRTDMYLESNYDKLQDTVAALGVNTAFAAGFSEVTVTVPILDELRPLRFFALFLGLILSVILTILFILSFMLIYSLLMISIETRTFELGVHRMTGLTRMGIIGMMVIQACSYSIPAWALGLILASIGSGVVTKTMSNTVDVPLDGALTGQSIAVASALGLLIPLVAVILPIREALGKNLQDALDTRHSKTMGVQFHIERSEDDKISVTGLALGIGLTVFGFLIYYMLPLSLISLNLSLFFNIFFGILLGLLFGLIILSLNFEHIIERFLVGIFFFWELSSIPKIVLKNLVAHRMRNRKTTIMYALSLAFIIFITVAYLTEIETAKANRIKQDGAPMVVTGSWRRRGSAHSASNENSESGGSTTGSATTQDTGGTPGVDTRRWRNEGLSYTLAMAAEKMLKDSPAVQTWAWMTTEHNDGFYDAVRTSNIGHYFEHAINVYGVSPSFFDVVYNDYYIAKREDRSTHMSLSEQLYTIRGEQSAAVCTGLADWYSIKAIDGEDSRFLLNQQVMQSTALANGLKTEATAGSNLKIHMMKTIAHMDSAAGIPFTAFRRNNPYQLAVSIPTYIALSNGRYGSAEDLSFSKLMIVPNPHATTAQLDAFKRSMRTWAAENRLRWISADDLKTTLAKTEDVMGIIFGVAMYLAMFLCMFSLIASMYSNIYESSKEIGVLRAIGLTINQITRIYLYEAFLLVVAASLLGMIIGFIIGFTMTLQRVLFTQLPLGFHFPWLYVVYVLTAAVICAFAAAWAPVRMLVRNSISSIFRTVM